MKKNKVISKLYPGFAKGIAHRGLHNEKYTENGLAAFKHAIDNDIPFEFDIHLTKDYKLIVCHDENLKRTTGKEGIIEDLTSEEIRNNYRLLDGGVVPTLEEVINLNEEKVGMVIELKVFRKNYKPLAKVFKTYLPMIKDKSKVMIISFDPRSLWSLHGLGFIRSLLVAKSDEYTWFYRLTVESVDVEKVLLEEKRVRRYAKNHFINVWTIKNEKDLDMVLPYVDTVTYQEIDHKLVTSKLVSK